MKDIVFSGHQPNFLPYMGFFYKMYKSDIFVYDDDVYYSSTGLHNSNFLKIQGQSHRVTVPVFAKIGDRINEVEIDYNRNWDYKMLKTVMMNYAKAPYFQIGYDLLAKHISKKPKYLYELNRGLLDDIVAGFGMKTKIITASKDVPTTLSNNDRNIYQCKKVRANVYYSGTGGKDYNDEDAYAREGIKVVYSDYKPVVYPQTGHGFIENLSVLDYIFNKGFEIPQEWSDSNG